MNVQMTQTTDRNFDLCKGEWVAGGPALADWAGYHAQAEGGPATDVLTRLAAHLGSLGAGMEPQRALWVPGTLVEVVAAGGGKTNHYTLYLRR